MAATLWILINVTVNTLSLLLLAYVLLSFFMSPFHPVRETLERIISPFLNPIRNFMPQTGMLDFSPLVLWLLLSLIRQLAFGTLQPYF